MAPQHVTTILLAEFDIDQGSVLTHQYPANITSDNHVLAELMLPDGAHLRPADWTIFFLNRAKPAPWNGNTVAADNGDNPLLYVLNLVRTNHDASIRRGAAVKAMAICTTHQYLHVYKPVLLLALENYFKNPSIEVLKTLYESVNSMQLDPPELSPYERMILRSSDNKELFIEKFEAAVSSEDVPAKVDVAHGLGIVVGQTPLKGKDGGSPAAAMAKNRDCQFYETKVVYDGIKIPIRVPLSINPEEVGEFSLIKLITTFSPSSPSPNPHPFHPHLDSNGPNTHPIMLLMNALLTGKRVIFLGNGHPAGDVANFVLAACALGSGSGGVLRGFPERAYPYTNLAGIDHLLTCKGFIAGVTNQLFEDRTAWWDVLCNIDTGKITVSKDISPIAFSSSHSAGHYDDTRAVPIFGTGTAAQSSSKHDNGDNEFMTDILNAIQAHYGEMVIRARFQEYVTRFVQLASQYEDQTYGQTTIGINRINTPESSKYMGTGLVFSDESSRLKEIAANASRIEGWRATTSYKYLQEDHKEWLATRSIRCMDVKRVISLLRLSRSLSSQDVSTLYRGFLQNIVTDEQIIEASPWEVDTGRNVETEVLFPAQNIYCASVTFK
ncbi:spindle pole body interacting protein [Linnemannia elongata AG-77]|uniref:Spindle pole body interacting protein n=1 Tax=Linnemannia elongata AG-77 TaxID=1314771 RepID=A0A197JRN0_9FUNG|nr:spindle pole body interacting protein [Linnemannia elongata AG-77]